MDPAERAIKFDFNWGLVWLSIDFVICGTYIAFPLTFFALQHAPGSCVMGFTIIQPVAALFSSLIVISFTEAPHFGLTVIYFCQIRAQRLSIQY